MCARAWLSLVIAVTLATGLASCASRPAEPLSLQTDIDAISAKVYLLYAGPSRMEGVIVRTPSRFILVWDGPLPDTMTVVRVRRVGTGEELARWEVVRTTPAVDRDPPPRDAWTTFEHKADPLATEEYELEVRRGREDPQTRRFTPRLAR